MRVLRLASLFISILLFASLFAAQQPPQRDPQAVATLQQALAAMGSVVPVDSIAAGSVVLIAGSKTDHETIRILTRGSDQSAVKIQTADGYREVVYSRDSAREASSTSSRSLQMELVVTSQSAEFPLALLASAIRSENTALQHIGSETISGFPARHVRFWNASYSSKTRTQHLVQFSTRDVWIDTANGIPRKLSYVRRSAWGAEGGVSIEVFYSDYRSVGGVLYPFHIEESLNGTPWATITIEHVTLANGLTDKDFPTE